MIIYFTLETHFDIFNNISIIFTPLITILIYNYLIIVNFCYIFVINFCYIFVISRISIGW